MRDKTMARWIMLQEFDDVNQICKEAREKGEIPETLKRYEKLYERKTKYSIEQNEPIKTKNIKVNKLPKIELKLPSEFIYIVYKNIVIKSHYIGNVGDVDKETNIKVECNLDIESVNNDLKNSIQYEYTQMAKEANKMFEKANKMSEEANKMSEEANKMSEEANIKAKVTYIKAKVANEKAKVIYEAAKEKNNNAKYECVTADCRQVLISQFLKLSWKIIDKYFPLTEYGFPSEDLIVCIMNKILNEELGFIEAKPKVVNGSYLDLIYIDKLKKENEDLKKFIKESINSKVTLIQENEINEELHNIKCDISSLSDVANTMIEAIDEDINMHTFADIINKNPKYFIEVNSNINSEELKNNSNDLANTIYKYNTQKFGYLNETESSNKTIHHYAYLYADRRFNKHMSNTEIVKDINKVCDDMGEYDTLSDDEKYLYDRAEKITARYVLDEIKVLCEQTGLTELNNEILKRNKEKKKVIDDVC